MATAIVLMFFIVRPSFHPECADTKHGPSGPILRLRVSVRYDNLFLTCGFLPPLRRCSLTSVSRWSEPVSEGRRNPANTHENAADLGQHLGQTSKLYSPSVPDSPSIAARAVSSDVCPYTSPVIAIEECPSKSATALIWTPASSHATAAECRRVCTPTSSMPT